MVAENLYSHISDRIKPSPIRALVPFIRQPGVISFAGGLPAPETFPVEQIQAIMAAAVETESPVIIQASRGARNYSQDAYLRHLILAAAELHPEIPMVMHHNVFCLPESR